MHDAIQIKSPECEKLCAVAPYSQKIGEFLDWVRETHGAILAAPHEHSKDCYGKRGMPMCGALSNELLWLSTPPSKLLPEFFGIDMDKVENERRAVLDALQGGK